ncbi:ATP-dependent RNA helicase BRR2 NDAI_0B02280 [Naumovozyma dairenensis CBS 421]|uniref:U5 small nuclear ribonucleoprotein 200 kDa helicase n=1 Tax=Naumovozyma dairenensis (strain ATCC 10597 / BCRC 20456 / CBS 421 / NBRC 0211 / NRRL Y-12639) TaxID=1071378 RepID=G0W652_NAUDC|nr:hypothetical protein NDAI_0B02280 [Naumovozyma dairenensis CBS 421]CCD23263.1 hypothetical protein NDAI_0B02280 [Naumovozyma dairenensis CBS 421]
MGMENGRTTDDASDKQKIKEIYRYDEMSNKVLKADKRFQISTYDPVKDAEKSHPKSLSGRISLKDMGTNLTHDLLDEEKEEAMKNVKRQQEKATIITQTKVNNNNNLLLNRQRQNESTLLDLDSVSPLKYYPSTNENLAHYDDVIQWVIDLLGNDIPHDIISDTADVLICSLKENDDELDGFIDKKRIELQNDIGFDIEPSKFIELVKITKNITDFNKDEEREEEIITENGVNDRDNIINVLANADDDSEGEEADEEDQKLLDQVISEEEGEEEAEEEENGKKQPMNNKNLKNKSLLPTDNEDIVIMKGESSTFMNEDIQIYAVDESFLKRKLWQVLDTQDISLISNTQSQIIDELMNTEYDTTPLNINLTKILGEDHASFINYIIRNRLPIIWGYRLSQSSEENATKLFEEMTANGLEDLVQQYKSRKANVSKRRLEDNVKTGTKKTKKSMEDNILDLATLKFDQGSKLMTVSKVLLPEGSFKRVKPHYDEIHIPAPSKPTIDYDLIPISSLPQWARKSFPAGETDSLNPIQSKVFPAAFKNDYNILLCAPTGAGKTNVALLAILRNLSHHYNEQTGKLNLNHFKVVYIAPLKALVQEQVREFQRRLGYLGIKVSELTGDTRLNRREISETHILVSTPEKWDIITRKVEDTSFVEEVRLIIIDEVHLLHDARGPVIESIVARTLWSQQLRERPRIVALSATLPNYKDVGKFLRVPADGLFYFDSSFRPCPLSQQFCGIKEQNAVKRLSAMNQACYDKVLESVSEGHQVIVFVHSRKDTARTAKWLKNQFTESDNINKIIKSDTSSVEILKRESETVQDLSLKSILTSGIGIHHAGLTRADRSLSEDLFADGLLQVLVSTATLAWGVNLPAHTVIIKGTEVYSPEKGIWEQLSPQDILQMLGRAGRPRYDTHGEGIIITNQQDVQYYLAVLNQQLPIESQFISRLIDNLNAEIVFGSVKNMNDALTWISYTYLYVRMLVSPDLYKVQKADGDDDLKEFRRLLLNSALQTLNKQGLIIYDMGNDTMKSTELGRIASYFYIKHTSIDVYNNELSEHSSQFDIFRIFALSDEFKYISIRQEERRELKELFEKVPIPIRETIDEPQAKTNILLQSYISRLRFDGFALRADMIFIQQNAGRLLRAMYELCLRQGWSRSTKILLNLCKSVERRLWYTNSPLRQFPNCPQEVIKRTESSTLPWNDYLNLESPAAVGRAIRSERNGKHVYDLIKRFPKVSAKCSIQPLTPSLLRIDLEIIPDWVWDKNLHGNSEPFLVMVEDIDGNGILYYESVFITPDLISQEYVVDFSIQLTPAQQKRLPPNFFVNVISEKWLHCHYQIAAILDDVRLPKKFPAPTELVNTELIPVSDLENEGFNEVFDFTNFNRIQSSMFNGVYNSNDNILICTAEETNRIISVELAILNHWRQNKGRALFICPSQEKIDYLLDKWQKKLSNIAGGKNINKLDVDLTLNLRIIARNHLILTTPEQFNLVSRRWRQRKNIQKIELFICDGIDQIGNGIPGALYESAISRILFMSTQLEKEVRIIATSTPLANARDLAEWIDVKKEGIFNYSPEVRVDPVEIHIQSFDGTSRQSYTPSMLKTVFDIALKTFSAHYTSLVFVAGLEECKSVCSQLLTWSQLTEWDLLNTNVEQIDSYLSKVHDSWIKRSLMHGIGVMYKGMQPKDRKVVQKLYDYGALSFLLVSKECHLCCPKSNQVFILGTSYFDGHAHRYINYTLYEILGMVSSVGKRALVDSGKAIILTDSNRKNYYRKFLVEPLPVESFIYYHLHDILLSEIGNNIIQDKQHCIDWMTYSYFYRRIHANPSFYGVKDISSFGISAYLTELIENVMKDLVESSMIDISEDRNKLKASEDETDEVISPLNGCLISSHNDVYFVTMDTFIKKLSKTSTLQDILETLSSATEFEQIRIRKNDYSNLVRLSKKLPLTFSLDATMNITSFKVFTLLQAHFSRIPLEPEFKEDLRYILTKSLQLVNSIIDILSGEGCLNATTAMDISQMIVQAIWDVDNPLRQIPFFDDNILAKCAEKKVETVYDIMSLEDDERMEIMMMENKKLVRVANFVNSYPNVALLYSPLNNSKIAIEQLISITVKLTRDDEPESLEVITEQYPFKKLENWWLVIGEVSKRELYAIKKVSLSKESQEYDLEFSLSSSGNHELTIWCVCDSYLDADKEVSFKLEVIE